MTDSRLLAIRDRLVRPSSVEEVRASLAELDRLAAEEPVLDGLEALNERAVHCLRSVTATDPGAAAEAIRRDLLPRCLVISTYDGPRRYSPYAQLCRQWLDDLPEEHRAGVRDEAIQAALAGLADVRARSALVFLSTLGYADPAVLVRLDELMAANDNRLGDHALAVRTSLGLPPERVLALRKELHRRIPRRWTVSLISAVKLLGDASTLEILFSTWFAPDPGARLLQSEPHLFDVTLGLLPGVANRYPAGDLATRILGRVLTLQSVRPEVERALEFDASLSAGFDSRAVVPELLMRAASATGLSRYRFYLRLKECVRPNQLLGWDDILVDYLRTVREDASRPTGMKGNFATIEFHRQTEAWNVLFSAGRVHLLPSISDVIAAEQNPYVCGELLELSACIGSLEFPAAAARLLEEQPAGAAWDENGYLVAYTAAVQAAHGAASRQSFDALLRFRPGQHGVLLSVVDALADTAEQLARAGDRVPLVQLLNVAEEAGETHTGEAAAAACAELYGSGILSPAEADRVASLAVSPKVNPFSRQSLLYALAGNPAASIPSYVLDEARALAHRSRALTPEELKAELDRAAVVMLASRPEAGTDIALLTECLGFRDASLESVPGLDPSRVGVAQAVGLLFGRDPDRFAGAVANVLRQANPPAASPALWAVRRTGHRIPIVEEALLERVSMMDDGRVSDPQVLEVAAAIIPEKLLSRGWEKLEQWIPQARAALAVTLASIGHLEEALAERRFELLVRLAGDGLHAVRRAAYRSLARCEEVRFAALLASWAVAHFRGGEAVRRRASEGCGWLPEAPVEGPLAALAWDPEESVRESFVQASAERDERRLAKMYGTSVLAVAKPEDVFRLWRYGAALGQVGDDHSVELLERKLGNDLAPSVRFWLKRVKTAVKRRWDKVTQAWPEPWFTRRGVTVPLRGVIKAPNGREIEVHGYIWRTTPEPPERLYTWGGWVVGGRLDVGENQLLLPGRRPVPILVTTLQFPSGPAVFSGAAEYPDA